MPAYKDNKTGTWYVQFYYETFDGQNKKKKKRGFKLKSEALEWENEFKLKNKGSSDMPFRALWDEYKENLRNEIKESTWETKVHIVDKKILPYFDNKPINQIDELMIRKWQNAMLEMKNNKGEPYSETYLKTINNQLSAILNHAVVYYKLPYNPLHRTGSIGSKHATERDYWTLEDFNKAVSYFEDDATYKLAFNLFFYTGMRLGEFLALNLNHFDLNECTVKITSNWGRRKKKNAITTTKSRSSNRVITFPNFIKPMLIDYASKIYGYEPNMRLFAQLNKQSLNTNLKRAAKASGVKEITIHELRHSHASLLINNNVNIKALQQRLGHKNIETTLGTYSHMYPTKQKEIADMLNNLEPK